MNLTIEAIAVLFFAAVILYSCLLIAYVIREKGMSLIYTICNELNKQFNISLSKVYSSWGVLLTNLTHSKPQDFQPVRIEHRYSQQNPDSYFH